MEVPSLQVSTGLLEPELTDLLQERGPLVDWLWKGSVS
jgi:hypothetical protein